MASHIAADSEFPERETDASKNFHSALVPPVAARFPFTRTFHNRDFIDDYEWLRDKDSAETRAYLEAENAYTKQQTAHLETLTDNVYNELVSRIKQTDMSIPVRMGRYWYYRRTEEGKEYFSLCRIPVLKGQDPWQPPVIVEGEVPVGEQVYLDSNELAQGHEFFSLGAASLTESGRFLAYSVDTAGDETFDLYVKDVETDTLLPDRLHNVFYGAAWAGEDYIFYQTTDDAWRPDRVWRHKVGTTQDKDVCVYHEPDEHFRVGVSVSSSEKYIIIGSYSSTTSELWYIEQERPEGSLYQLWSREPGVEYDVDHAVVDGEDRWLVTHNALGANFAVGWVPVAGAMPKLQDINPLVAHSDDVRILGVSPYRDFVTMAYRRGGIPRVAVMQLGGSSTASATQGFGEFKELDFDEEVYSVSSLGNPEWDAPVIQLSYTSYTQPTQLWQYEVATGERTLLKEQEVLGGYDANDYEAFRLWAQAVDGTQIPVSVVKRKDTDMKKPSPALLYGYGSYEASMDPYFSVARLSLLDRGMLYVVAHVRGGGEMGRLWYDNGKLMNKANTFTDFIAVADYLIDQGLTSPDQLVAEGGSAGGLLMGVVANMAPDRFTAIQANVPFVDPLTSILKPELPLTVGEWEEWGDPFHDPEVYDYMATYSPYENISAQDYPDILALTTLNDTRVLYVEPAKWIAKLRTLATGGEFLLKTE
ncbi:MAG: S9 family peptidase, partial [Corynebacterium sp.]|nr:S9 family peptidase [Corynebacterium sp.]